MIWYIGNTEKSGCSLLILTSSTIDKKLKIYKNLEIELEIDKNLEIELEIYKNLENFEFYFEIFVISSFLSMVDEVNITVNTEFHTLGLLGGKLPGYF